MGIEEEYNRNTFKGLIAESAEDLYEHAPCGYLSTLPNGTIVKVNKTFLTWTGYTSDELLHKKFQDLLAMGSRIYYETHFGPLLRMQGFVNQVNFEIKTRLGHKLPTLVNTTQLTDAQGNPVLLRTTVLDITDRKKYEQELLRAKKQAEEGARVKAEFLSTVSHEIRTPMNAIISIANLLQGMPHSTEQEEYFRILKLSADNLLHLINDILDYSKIESGHVSLAEKSINLKDLVYTLIYSVGITAAEKGLDLQVNIDEQLPAYILGDPIKIGQVLTNLLSNAIKFTEEGTVTLDLQVQEPAQKHVTVVFRVSDTGIGIPADRLEQVFEKFTQANYDINLKYGGTGLGLAICQKLLALYGSKLTVESEEGKGTTFRFSLTLKCSAPAATTPEAVPVAGADTGIAGVKLLLVEDNNINVLVVSKYLEKWGVNFEVATNGKDALEKVTQQDYDLVLMDLQMPEMDGYEASASIRRLPGDKFRQLPIIALTASTRFNYNDKLEAAGINDFVSKPFNANELRLKIAFYARGSAALAPLATDVEAPPAAVQSEDSPAFTLGQFEELLDQNEAELEELVRITIRNFESSRKELQKALETHNLKAYGFWSHKIKMTVNLLQAHQLKNAIQDGKKILDLSNPANTRTEAAAAQLAREFSTVVQGLKQTLLNRWQPAT